MIQLWNIITSLNGHFLILWFPLIYRIFFKQFHVVVSPLAHEKALRPQALMHLRQAKACFFFFLIELGILYALLEVYSTNS